MPRLDYAYFNLPGLSFLRPVASCVATNIRNGRSASFIGILDTGADMTSLSKDLLGRLNINPSELRKDPTGGVGDIQITSLYCDFIKISFVDVLELTEHSPNGNDPVPLHFTDGAVNLLGQHYFLDLCRACFDGPKKIVHIDF